MITAALFTSVTGADAPADLTDRAAYVVARLEDALGRPLTYGTRTERCRCFADGVAYPKATPVHAATGFDTDGVAVYTGQTGWVNVTYTGGYSSVTSTVAARRCPQQLAAAIAWGVHTLTTPADTVLPAGVESLNIAGEYSISKASGTVLGADGHDVPAALTVLADLGGRCATLAARYRRR
jgi:hypothetical protein